MARKTNKQLTISNPVRICKGDRYAFHLKLNRGCDGPLLKEGAAYLEVDQETVVHVRYGEDMEDDDVMEPIIIELHAKKLNMAKKPKDEFPY